MLLAPTNMQVTTAEYAAWRALLDNSLARNKIDSKGRTASTALIDAVEADLVNH